MGAPCTDSSQLEGPTGHEAPPTQVNDRTVCTACLQTPSRYQDFSCNTDPPPLRPLVKLLEKPCFSFCLLLSSYSHQDSALAC